MACHRPDRRPRSHGAKVPRGEARPEDRGATDFGDGAAMERGPQLAPGQRATAPRGPVGDDIPATVRTPVRYRAAATARGADLAGRSKSRRDRREKRRGEREHAVNERRWSESDKVVLQQDPLRERE